VGSGNSGSGGEIVLSSGLSSFGPGGDISMVTSNGSIGSSSHGSFVVNVGGQDRFKISESGSTQSSFVLEMESDGASRIESFSTLTITGGTSINLIAGASSMTLDSNGLKVDAAMTVTGNLMANQGVTTSDSRLKTDVLPLKDSLEKVSKLRGVYFSWVKSRPEEGLFFDEKRHVGVVAQDVQLVLPEIVGTVAHGGNKQYLGVDYPSLIPLLVEAVRELDERTTEKANTNAFFEDKQEWNELRTAIRLLRKADEEFEHRLTVLEVAHESLPLKV
jgi:hypothetical protein